MSYRKPGEKASVIHSGDGPPFLSRRSDGTCVRKARVVYCSGMSKKQQPQREQIEKEPRRKTPTFLLELPLEVQADQAKQLPTHLDGGSATAGRTRASATTRE